MRVSVSVRDALSSNRVYIVFQPVVDFATFEPYGYEALCRSELPEYNNPLHLLKAAIDSGDLGHLGRELRRLSIEGCPSHPLLLNIHPDEFDEGYLVRPDDPIHEHEKQVYLEITESVPISHYRYCNSVLTEIRAKGVRIAVDDLGAGFSNFKYIADLEPELVKLDRELIMGLTHGSRRQKLVRSIVRMCVEQGAKVVAEGIETAEELSAILETGAHYGQGYLLARPARTPPLVSPEVFSGLRQQVRPHEAI